MKHTVSEQSDLASGARPATRFGSARRVLMGVLCALAAALALSTTTTMAWAEAPFDPGSALVTDHADALSSDEVSAANSALSHARDETGIAIHEVFVTSLDGTDSGQWAQSAAQKAGYGTHDVVVVIATGDREYGYWYPSGFGYTSVLKSATDNAAQDYLANNEWGKAAVAIGDNFTSGVASAKSRPAKIGITLGIVVVLIGAAVAFGLIRRKRKQVAAVKADGVRAGQAVLAMDEALRRAREELGFAEASFAKADIESVQTITQQFADRAQEVLTAYTGLAPSASLTDKRAAYRRVLDSSDVIIQGLARQASVLADLRTKAEDIPGTAADVRTRIDRCRSLLGTATSRQAELEHTFATDALRHSRDVLAALPGLLTDAEEKIARAEAGMSAGRTGYEVIGFVTAAEADLANADATIDGVQALGKELENADEVNRNRLQQIEASLDTVATLRSRAEQHGVDDSALTDAVAEAQGVVYVGIPETPHDPVELGKTIDAAQSRLANAMSAVESAINVIIQPVPVPVVVGRRGGWWGGGGFGGGGWGGGSSGGGGSFGGGFGGGSFGGGSGGGSFGGGTGGGRF